VAFNREFASEVDAYEVAGTLQEKLDCVPSKPLAYQYEAAHGALSKNRSRATGD
jgi:hypothetical protein